MDVVSISADTVRPGSVVTGPLLPEPIEVVAVLPLGESVKLIGNLRLRPGQQAALTVDCYDQHDRPYPCPAVAWHVSDGRIDERGHFAAETVGAYTVRAVVADGGAQAAEPVQATTTVEVLSGETPLPPPPPSEKGLSWQGTVPAQKWSNFYLKVLSRLALTACFRTSIDGHAPGA